ncbi:MAG: HAMP domain-containing histidine kinase [Candidatus Didemnitutus sp.]|nr:HAMP domain-containing histidine kinase [Candidatus Didemnitutus sp.]
MPDSGQLSHARALSRLVSAVQALSQARTIEDIREIVRHAARELTGADGATFVLRDGDQCHYIDEDAIAPLWKGQRFPMSACVSGWVMLNRQPAVVRDIFDDPRVPVDAYRATFVRSLVMVPIRTESPVGAIGTYWSSHHDAQAIEVEVLVALANTTAVALENVRSYTDLESCVRLRTKELEEANHELESFASSVSHDLRAPLGVISGAADLLRLKNANLDPESARLMAMIPTQVRRMSALIDDLLRLSRIRQAELKLERVDLAALARDIASALFSADPSRQIRFTALDVPPAACDPALLRIALENLLSNAWKYTQHRDVAEVVFASHRLEDRQIAYFVSDNGAGFRPEDTPKLFTPFRRLHDSAEFSGTGVGLTIVARIIEKHGGRVWAEAQKDVGAVFYFTLGASPL